MKLTADLINNSPSFINPIKDRELDLSRNHIPLIENLGATKASGDKKVCAISEDIITVNTLHLLLIPPNSIRILGNFPSLPRLQRLYMADNRIVSIESSLSEFLPHLNTLILTNNEISELIDLEPLRGLTNLTSLSLVNNPVMRKKNARLWCIWRLPKTLRVLDFEKIKEKERQEAKELFEKKGELTEAARAILAIEGTKTSTFEPGEGLGEKEEAGDEMDEQKKQEIEDLKAKIRSEMAQVEAIEEFI
ncbi:U2 snRNP complex subunit [Linderina macrospora]|uniref:U2 snRNP complex subunit n=1 Tax=Linderina macrospora TaxID=4868 RepID=A0ACC1JB51_9FUNG|nr:U2 snRNP complex subunit [Linderina macrospora]